MTVLPLIAVAMIGLIAARPGASSPRSNSADGLPPVGWSAAASAPNSWTTRWNIADAEFPPLNEVVFFGGAPKVMGETWSNTTWQYSTTGWSVGPGAPQELTPRGGSAMAYDPAIGKIVLFGGEGPEWPPTMNDTWLFDGTAWAKVSTQQAPAARQGAEMVYDPDIGKIVLFGGSGTDVYTDTWLFDGATWTKGPAAPTQMLPRIYFGMTYDPDLHAVYVAGGDGGVDTWLFDGTSWTPGPDLPDKLGAKERVRMAYDPDLHAAMVFGGIGPGYGSSQLWMLRSGAWTMVPGWNKNPGKPTSRLDASVAWLANADAMMVFGGVGVADPGTNVYLDCWMFREAAPSIRSVSLSPSHPYENQWISSTRGATDGGYGKLTYVYAWFVNGTRLQGAAGHNLGPGPYQVGDRVQLKIQVTDALGLSSPWTPSNSLTIADRPPTLGPITLTPKPTYTADTLVVTSSGATDPDGDAVTVHYAWTVDANPVAGNDQPSLTPDHFTGGDTVGVTATPVDQWGMAGDPRTGTYSIAFMVRPSDAHPGGNVVVSGSGYGPSEVVELRLDSPSGALLGTTVTDGTGSFSGSTFAMPAPLLGGTHTVWGTGRSSGRVGFGAMTVVPVVTPSPFNVAAGATTTVTTMGFKAGEQVAMSFPGAAPTVATADANGTAVATLTSPPEPYPGGVITATAPSASATGNFGVTPVLTAPKQGQAGGTTTMSVTGFGAIEQVQVSFDGGGPVKTFVTDGSGSGSAQVTLPPRFGTHTMTATGLTTGATKSVNITLPATMTLSPTSGSPGQTVTVDSGPGWIPNEVVHVYWASTYLLEDVTANASGVVHTTFVVPNHQPGQVNVSLKGAQSGFLASAPFTVK